MVIPALRATALLVGLAAISGCASAVATGGVDTAQYEAMSCEDLNVAMGEKASDLSKTAISRGKVEKLSVPNWLLGGTRAVGAVTSRQTARIERLQAEEAAIHEARKRRC
ncbi:MULTISPECIES: hypothetical protein [unclassified Mesorhizobium]|uniref:hypothetical protein n=1 Tax=unclassified Mesorhizobium TaxID=325217 RepID=UPI000A6B5EB2|nr:MULTISPECIES: hypothetical protein [unclassified Mesorhizobium]MDR7032302.1 hypothetical protein [Mesorhizobium sp. BE184]